ncbi:MAG: MBL fold metallo-hydrolase, partial [Melioribacter sp.]|nr:MBL fold metallo-hydrolase [Melioribacter sp.]
LIDTGIGYNWDEKFSRIYNIEHTEMDLLKSLSALNIKSEEITDVLLTHLHFDHTGGATKLENNKWIPAFPNAKYYVQKKHFEWAVNPSERDRASFVTNRFMPLYESGVLNLLNEEEYFDDEIQILISNGHTFSQQLIKISDSSTTILFCSDLFPFTSHISLPYITGYDLQPLVTLKEKKDILNKAVEQNWIIFFEHDPFTLAATITKNEKGFIVNEKFTELK